MTPSIGSLVPAAMQPTPEIDAFVRRIQTLSPGSGISLDAALQPSLDEEAELRTLFATDRQNSRLSNPYVGLIDVFVAPDAIRATRARVVQEKEDLSSQYVMPLSADTRRQEGAACMVPDLEEFKKNWAIFTEGSLLQLLDWNNVIAAGGSVLACLSPLDEEHKKSKRAIRKYYHNKVYPTSDVDLFLWGLDVEQAEAKIRQIYEAVRDSVPWDVTCIRTKHTISIHSQYPYRSVQIVLRLYHSPAEVLAGFDIDAPCCAYDGNRVWANPRAVIAMMRQCNTVDMTRRSPSYEVRLAKYAERRYEVYVPTLDRDKVDPTIYERSIMKIKGLARLLVLERLKDDRMRSSFLHERRQLRDRPSSSHRRARINRRRFKGDLKQNDDKSLEMNNYDVGTLHIPYGPGWDARRIDKLVYQTDLGMNSTFNPKNKGRRLHRHAGFFGTAEEVLEDCCEHCSKPIDKDEEELQRKEDESYIRGRIQFIDENPGRQSMTGSFNPIDEGEWSEQAYIHPTALLFQAIAKHDRATVLRLLKDVEADSGGTLHRRDHVGRTSLHVAILVKAVEIAEDLIEAGARITARLADGRAPLHLAAQYDLPTVINKLVERSKKNQFDSENPKDSVVDLAQPAPERPSSEDDWSSHDDEDAVKSFSEGDADDEEDNESDHENEDKGRKTSKEKKQDDSPDPQDDVPDDVADEPDIINVNIQDWDFGFSPLCYAVLYGSLSTLEALLAAGADPRLPTAPSTSTSYYLTTPFHPLTLTISRKDDSLACEVAELLIKAGATSTTADPSVRTIFHSLVCSGRTRLVETVLRCDPNIDKVINLPHLQWSNAVFPIVTAIQLRCYSTLMVIVAHGARLDLQEIDITKARDAASEDTRRSVLGYREVDNYLHLACQPVEAALGQYDDVVQLIISLGATIDFGLKRSLEGYSTKRPSDGTVRRAVKDWVEFGLTELTERILKKESELLAPVAPTTFQPVESPQTGWRAYLKEYEDSLKIKTSSTENSVADAALRAKQQALEEWMDAKAYLSEVQEVLSKHNAKTWNELYPSMETDELKVQNKTPAPPSSPSPEKGEWVYVNLSKGGYGYRTERVPQHLVATYDELYEACYNGDNEKIQKLCLPEAGSVEGDETPLNISVRYVTKPTGFYYPNWGYTPLSVAVAGRRWSTAKLILAIAAAQYEPDEVDEIIEFNIDAIDDDDSDIDSDDSDITIDQEQVRFVDIATRSSQVRIPIHPKQLLNTPMPYCKPRRDDDDDDLTGQAPILKLAVMQSDLDSFVHIINLYESLPQSLELPDLMDIILEHDQAQILNEYIRRTGNGIDIAGAQESAKVGSVPIAINDENKIYLGLNVHGKKRVDLAKKNDPNATGNDSPNLPLLWRAITAKAGAIISYLGSEGPLAAYRHYASVHSDSKAIWFKRLGIDEGGELEKWLPSWLGWSCEGIGESPLSTAITSGDVEIVKLVAKLNPKLFTQSMQTEIKFLSLNPLLLAVGSSGNIEVVDFLLKNKVSPSQRDAIKGWNLYHFICSANMGDLLKFFLDKLPRDVNESLLAEKSRYRRNTPLHLAVKCGNEALVSILLDYTKDGLLAQDVDGQTPLHCAVAKSYSTIVNHLLRVIPKEGLVVENGVGNTPREIVALAELRACCTELSRVVSQSSSGGTLSPDSILLTDGRIPAIHFSKYEAELRDLRDIVPGMVDRGTVPDERKSHMKNEIQNWVNKMLGAFEAAKEREERKEAERKARKDEEEKKKRRLPDENPYPSDTADLKKTFQLMTDACEAIPDTLQLRGLIHLLDVQKSVGYSLTKVNPNTVDDEFDGPPELLRILNKRKYTRRSTDLDDYEAEPEQSQANIFMSFNSFVTADPW